MACKSVSVGGGVERRRRREAHTCISISLFGKKGGGLFKEAVLIRRLRPYLKKYVRNMSLSHSLQ